MSVRYPLSEVLLRVARAERLDSTDLIVLVSPDRKARADRAARNANQVMTHENGTVISATVVVTDQLRDQSVALVIDVRRPLDPPITAYVA
jgi:hypothetical protein